MGHGKYSHTIEFDLSQMPTVMYTDIGHTDVPIFHVDRTASHEVLLLILRGVMPVVEDETEYVLKAGDVFLLKKGVHHYGRTEIEPGTSWIYVHFVHREPANEELVLNDDYSQLLHMYRAPKDYERKILIPKWIHNTLNTDIEVKFRKLHELFSSQNPYLMAYVNPCLHELLMDIFLYSKRESEQNDNDARVHQILQFLSRHVNSVLIPEELEEHMKLSYKHLSRIFKEYTGLTLHECHTRMKMERACRLLRDSAQPIAYVGEQVGYNDPLYFSKVFTRHMGCSPTAWREKKRSIYE